MIYRNELVFVVVIGIALVSVVVLSGSSPIGFATRSSVGTTDISSDADRSGLSREYQQTGSDGGFTSAPGIKCKNNHCWNDKDGDGKQDWDEDSVSNAVLCDVPSAITGRGDATFQRPAACPVNTACKEAKGNAIASFASSVVCPDSCPTLSFTGQGVNQLTCEDWTVAGDHYYDYDTQTSYVYGTPLVTAECYFSLYYSCTRVASNVIPPDPRPV